MPATHAGMSGTGQHSDPASAAPLTPLGAGERFQTLTMANPYTPNPPAHGTDDYRCFLVDPKLAADTFLTGSQFLPDNADIVHHAIFFKLDAKDVDRAEALDAQAPGDGYTCFSGTGINDPGQQLAGAPWLASWAPGVDESLAARGSGYRMEAGSRIIMQVHYNLLATNGKATGADRSGIRLRLAPAAAGLVPLHTTLLAAPIELPCPSGETGRLCDRDMSVFDTIRRFGDQSGADVAGLNLICNQGRAPVPGNTQHCDSTGRQTMVVQAVAGHMHLLGRSIKVELNPGTARTKTLLDVPVYNFDDQGARPLRKPITVRAGDKLRVTCTHDATLRARTPALQMLKPRYVVWGEGTSDEMCLGIVIWTATRLN
jgi:copper type II ascorbate-dependent monooxygenase-like protein